MKNIIKKLIKNKDKSIETIVHPAKFKETYGWFIDRRVHEVKDSPFHKYEIRSDDDGKGDPIEISTKVLVNFYGTFLSKEEINLPLTGLNTLPYDNIKESDLNIRYDMQIKIRV